MAHLSLKLCHFLSIIIFYLPQSRKLGMFLITFFKCFNISQRFVTTYNLRTRCVAVVDKETKMSVASSGIVLKIKITLAPQEIFKIYVLICCVYYK